MHFILYFFKRKIVSSLVANNMHEVLLHNDQLSWNMSKGLVLQNFTGKFTSLTVQVKKNTYQILSLFSFQRAHSISSRRTNTISVRSITTHLAKAAFPAGQIVSSLCPGQAPCSASLTNPTTQYVPVTTDLCLHPFKWL